MAKSRAELGQLYVAISKHTKLIEVGADRIYFSPSGAESDYA